MTPSPPVLHVTMLIYFNTITADHNQLIITGYATQNSLATTWHLPWANANFIFSSFIFYLL